MTQSSVRHPLMLLEGIQNRASCRHVAALSIQMRMFESAVRIVSRIIEEELEIAVPQRAAGGVKIEDLDCSGLNGRGFVLLCVEFKDVVSIAVFRCLDLLEQVFVAEEPKVANHTIPY
jgi:hypothetical protein